ncbi:hypothetical protein DRV84_01920 [Rhodosalinus sediminis]|uniref:histidine kinase n=1 Tax=Rhodosalinus sediminis TaxID=1940533 RepID=A0A3D9BXX6_9RHOB|nr:Hpt domain-containing protein [Rhodosalinus sediminis]REC58349.1 hypothetical protein DRV84_01920 [Rhodosalinus sediminis]
MSDEMNEIWALFADDGGQALDQVEEALLELKDAPEAADPDTIAALFRAMHTFKGNARVLGLATIENRAHVAEDLIGLVRDEGVPLDAEILDLLFEISDTLRGMLETACDARTDVEAAPSETLVGQLRAKIAACSGEAAEPPADPAPAPEGDGGASKREGDGDATGPEVDGGPKGSEGHDGAPGPEADDGATGPEADAAAPPETAPETSAETPTAGDGAAPADDTAPAEGGAGAEVGAADAGGARLFDQPTYRRVFEKLARGAVAAMADLSGTLDTDPDAALPEMEKQTTKLRTAAQQVGLTAWHDLAAAYLDAPGVAAAKRTIAAFETRRAVDLDGAPEPAEAPESTDSPETTDAPETADAPEADAPAAAPGAAPEGSAQTVPRATATDPRPARADTPGGLIDNPTYRRIFVKIADENLSALREIAAAAEGEGALPAQAAERAQKLRNAAGQMGLETWLAALDGFAALDAPGAMDLERLLAALDAAYRRDIEGAAEAPPEPPAQAAPAPAENRAATSAAPAVAGDAPVPPETGESAGGATQGATDARAAAARHLMQDLEPLLAELSELGGAGGDVVFTGRDALADLSRRIASAAEAQGFERVAEAGRAFATVQDPRAFRDVEFDFYEELISLEVAYGHALGDLATRPSVLLRAWCAENAYVTLLQLGEHVDELRAQRDVDDNRAAVMRLLKRMSQACAHYEIETAADLALSLYDLIARSAVSGKAPDPVLLHIAQSYTDLLELVFDAIEAGETPDTDALERLFVEASRATFVITNAPSAAEVEARLGLPEAFHRVMSPESVKAASRGMDLGQHFYILRTDLNDDEAAAQRFLDWLERGEARPITSVTVFVGEAVLFDFLVATRLEEEAVRAALAEIDPSGKAVRVETELPYDRDGAAGRGARAAEPAARPGSALREELSEVVAEQSLLAHTISDLLQTDLAAQVTEALPPEAVPGADWPTLRGALEKTGEALTTRLGELQQTTQQLQSRLVQLQEDMIALSQAEASELLDPMGAHIREAARAAGRRLAVTLTGEKTRLDDRVIGALDPALRALIDARLRQSPEGPQRLHVCAFRAGELFGLRLEDDLPAPHDDAALDGLRSAVDALGGTVCASAPPTGEQRLEITVPAAMSVLQGMVVRDAEVSYVVPTEAIARIVHCAPEQVQRISAEEGRYVLNLDGEGPLDIGALQQDAASGLQATLARARERLESLLFLIVRHAERSVALRVEEIVGQQVVLVRPMRGALAGVRGVTGCALLGNGDVGLALAVPSLVDR